MDFNTTLVKHGLDPSQFDEKGLRCEATSYGFNYFVTMKSQRPCCPKCGRRTNIYNHGFYTKKINITLNSNIHEYLYVKVRRFRCENLDCPVQTFNVELKGIEVNRSIPANIFKHIMIDLSKNISISKIAETYDVAPNTVLYVLDELVSDMPRFKLTNEICIDEFKFRSGKQDKYPVIIVDGNTSSLIDIVRSRRKEILFPYFADIPLKEREKVRFFNSDMFDTYRFVLRNYFKQATHIIDPFHIVKLITTAMSKERAKVFRHYSMGNILYRFQKVYWEEFVCRKRYIDNKVYQPTDRSEMPRTHKYMLNEIFQLHPNLWDIYDALQALFDYLDGRMNVTATEAMYFIERKLYEAGGEARKAADSFQKWHNEIRQTFELRQNGEFHSNSPAEGMNNQIATLIKSAYGLVDFPRLRKRALLIFGFYSKANQAKQLDALNLPSLK